MRTEFMNHVRSIATGVLFASLATWGFFGTPSATAAPQEKVASLPERTLPKREGDITFDDIKFEMKVGDPFKRELLTPEIEKLNGKTIRIRGFILPASVFQQSGIASFTLVRDNQECCFGPGAALYDCVMVFMKSPATANFTTRPIAVKGRFEVKEFTYPDGGGHYAIYQIVDATEAK